MKISGLSPLTNIDIILPRINHTTNRVPKTGARPLNPNLPRSPKIIAICAIQGTAIAIIVAEMKRSFLVSIIRVASAPGTLQPKPSIIGIIPIPCIPI